MIKNPVSVEGTSEKQLSDIKVPEKKQDVPHRTPHTITKEKSKRPSKSERVAAAIKKNATAVQAAAEARTQAEA